MKNAFNSYLFCVAEQQRPQL